MATGKCVHCGYSPVSTTAQFFPRCGGLRPNPAAGAWILPVVFMAVILVLFMGCAGACVLSALLNPPAASDSQK